MIGMSGGRNRIERRLQIRQQCQNGGACLGDKAISHQFFLYDVFFDIQGTIKEKARLDIEKIV
jgi:hypothetical protein